MSEARAEEVVEAGLLVVLEPVSVAVLEMVPLTTVTETETEREVETDTEVEVVVTTSVLDSVETDALETDALDAVVEGLPVGDWMEAGSSMSTLLAPHCGKSV